MPDSIGDAAGARDRRDGRPSAQPAVEFVMESVPRFAERLRAAGGKDEWLMGGAGLIASLLDAGEIDEFVIHAIPVFIGEGIPLIAPRHREVPLELLSTRAFPDGVVQVRYAVRRGWPDAGPTPAGGLDWLRSATGTHPVTASGGFQ